MTDRIVTLGELSKIYCVTGVRRWFDATGLDFRDFARNGISAQKLLDTEDQLALNAVSRLEEEDGRK